MRRVLLLTSLLLATASCKGEKSRPPDVDHAPPTGPKTDTAPAAADTSEIDLYGDSLPQHATGRLGSLRMIDRSIRNMIFTANGSQAISTHQDGFQIWNLTDASRGALLPQENPGEYMAVSPNGKNLATNVDETNKIALWDLESGKKTAEVDAGGPLIGLCFLDDRQLLTASDGSELKFWPLGTDAAPTTVQGAWSEATALGCNAKGGWIGIGTQSGDAYLLKAGGDKPVKLGSASKEITSVAIAPDGGTFAFGSADENLLLWHQPTAGEPMRIQAHERHVTNLAFTEDSSKLYSTGGDWWFRIWDPKLGDMIEEMPGIDGLEAQLMALSPDGNLMLSWSQHGNERGSEAGRWWLWNAGNGALLLEPARHRLALTSVEFSPDGTLIVTGSEDRKVRIWDRKSTKSLQMLDGAEGPINDVHFASDGKSVYLAGVDALVRNWSWESGAERVAIESVGGAVNRFAIDSRSGRAITGDQIGRVWAWDMKSGNQIQAYDRQGYSAIYDIDLSEDGQLLAIGGSARIVRIIDVNAGREVAQLNPGDTHANFAVRFSADGKWLATAGDGHKIQIWNTSDWTRLITLPGHDGTVRCVDFSKDGKRVVSGGNDEMVRVWDVDSGKELATFSGHEGVITDLAISPDDKTIVSASRDRTALLWAMP